MATDADKGLHLLKVAAGDHTDQFLGDHHWGQCPACLAYQELEHGDGRRFLQAFLASLEQREPIDTAHCPACGEFRLCAAGCDD